MSFDENILPSYTPELLALCDLPEYSPAATDQERLLPCDNPSSSRAHHTYCSKTFTVSLGEKLWGLNIPAYGCNGSIYGTVHLHDSRVSQVTIELRGWVATTSYEEGPITNPTRNALYSKAKVVQSSSIPTSSNIEFTLPIPNEIGFLGQTIPTPASQLCSSRGTTVHIYWELDICVSRKGFRMNDKHKIPILYLPKSRPLSSHLVDFPPCIPPDDDRIRMIELPLDKPKGLDVENIILTVPSIRTFAAGCRLPISITVRGNCTAQTHNRDGASFMEALCSSTSVTLLKQTSIVPNGYAKMISSESRVSYVETFEIMRLSANRAQLKAWLYAGACGKESTCNIPGVVQVKYLLKIASKPTSEARGEYAVPAFSHTEELELTTDPWGTSEWELRATRGVPIPALGLASASSHHKN